MHKERGRTGILKLSWEPRISKVVSCTDCNTVCRMRNHTRLALELTGCLKIWASLCVVSSTPPDVCKQWL